MNMKPRILLASDQALVVQVFAKVLRRYFDLVAAVSDASELLHLAPQLSPDVVVMDLAMAFSDGQNTSEQLIRLLPDTKQIVLVPDENCEIPAASLRSTSGFLMQRCAPLELVHAVKKVLKERRYLTAGTAQRMADLFPSHAKHLTPRQSQVLQLLAEGRTMKEAAATLRVTARTIAFHKYRIMDEFDLKTNSDLVRFAIKKGLLASP
jgi:DNA-binding NarL/FixJ family response regulator